MPSKDSPTFRGTIRIYDGHPTTPQACEVPWVELPMADVHYDAVFDATSGLWLPRPSPDAEKE